MNHYERLGVERDVSPADLRRAYRELARLHHPDHNRDDAEGATQRMAAINEAFEVLRDPVRKFDYNRSLDRGGGQRSGEHASSTEGPVRQTASSRHTRPTQPPADDPIRRARREAKEREAAEARKRGYRNQDPGGGFFGRMNFRRPR